MTEPWRAHLSIVAYLLEQGLCFVKLHVTELPHDQQAAA